MKCLVACVGRKNWHAAPPRARARYKIQSVHDDDGGTDTVAVTPPPTFTTMPPKKKNKKEEGSEGEETCDGCSIRTSKTLQKCEECGKAFCPSCFEFANHLYFCDKSDCCKSHCKKWKPYDDIYSCKECDMLFCKDCETPKTCLMCEEVFCEEHQKGGASCSSCNEFFYCKKCREHLSDGRIYMTCRGCDRDGCLMNCMTPCTRCGEWSEHCEDCHSDCQND